MAEKFSYSWYIQQFKKAKDQAEEFILSVDEARFVQPPAEGRWSIAECYSHLINYGNLYYPELASITAGSEATTQEITAPFPPRWIFKKIISWFEPPYKIKLKTVPSMQPDPVSGYNRMELLDEYVNLQEQFIALLEKGEHRHVDLAKARIAHPIVPMIKMTLTECYGLAEAHQRRHHWQAQQTLKALKNRH